MPEVDGRALCAALERAALEIEENKDYLCELDSTAGDGDHGVSMTIGMRAARRNLAGLERQTPSACFNAFAEAFADDVGASIGPLYEVAFASAAEAVEGRFQLNEAAAWSEVFKAISGAIEEVGRAKRRDKTLLDAWGPASEALVTASENGLPLVEALGLAAKAAEDGVERTRDLIPQLGRASRLGERARGAIDPGAASASIIIRCIAREIAGLS